MSASTAGRRKPVAVVTGGRQGLGKGSALALASAGFDVVIVDVENDAKTVATLAEIEARSGQSKFVHGDIGVLEKHEDLCEAIWRAFGGVDCLVNNAGVPARPLSDVLEMTPASFDSNLDTNLRGTFFLTQRVVKRMLADGPRGFHRSIIVFTSIAAEIVSTTRGEYCMSKAALSMMTKLLAARLASESIFVHELRPGFMRTEMTAGAAEQTGRLIESGYTPMRRWGEPSDVGMTVVALATGALPFTTGQPIFVDGGLHIHRVD